MRICPVCSTSFHAVRSTARYCSDRCRQRARRAGGATALAARSHPRPVTSASGKAARHWLGTHQLDPRNDSAAADLLILADAIDTTAAAGQIQHIAQLVRQAAANRHELTTAHALDADD